MLSKLSMLSFYIKEIKAYNGIYEPVNVVGSSGGPLETEAVEHLRGIVVGSFYPACLMANAHIVSHQRSQDGNQVRILHHILQCFTLATQLTTVNALFRLSHAWASVTSAAKAVTRLSKWLKASVCPK